MENIGFVSASDLKTGDKVRLQSGETAAVESTEKVQLDKPIKVYNFEVEDFHTYYVSEQQVLVHNTCVEESPKTVKKNPNVKTRELIIINKKHSGNKYPLTGELAEKYPESVSFSDKGFPDFSPYSVKTVEVENLIGDTYHDFKAANDAAGLIAKPKGFTWHHVEDGRTMMLVPTDLHRKVAHTGGAAIIRRK